MDWTFLSTIIALKCVSNTIFLAFTWHTQLYFLDELFSLLSLSYAVRFCEFFFCFPGQYTLVIGIYWFSCFTFRSHRDDSVWKAEASEGDVENELKCEKGTWSDGERKRAPIVIRETGSRSWPVKLCERRKSTKKNRNCNKHQFMKGKTKTLMRNWRKIICVSALEWIWEAMVREKEERTNETKMMATQLYQPFVAITYDYYTLRSASNCIQ